MSDLSKQLFYSVIAFGVVFIAALLAGGIALHCPVAVIAAVLVAGGSYLTQVGAAFAAALPYGAPAWLTSLNFALWMATALLGVVGVVALIGA